MYGRYRFHLPFASRTREQQQYCGHLDASLEDPMLGRSKIGVDLPVDGETEHVRCADTINGQKWCRRTANSEEAHLEIRPCEKKASGAQLQ